MLLLLRFTFALFFSQSFAFLAKKLRVVSIVGLLTASLFFSITAFREAIVGAHLENFIALGNVGLIGLMFLAGLESSWHEIYKEKREALIIAVCAMLTPLFFGYCAFKFLLGFSTLTSLAGAICISITAEATKAQVLLELKKLKTRVGAAMMGAGIIDDLLGLLLFTGISYFLGSASLKEDSLILGVIVAFFAGILVQKIVGRQTRWLKKFERIVGQLIVPFFFIAVGLHFDASVLLLNPAILILTLVAALVGKLGGTLLTKPFVKMKWQQLHLIGWAMNSRGAIGLALALLAFRNGSIPIDLYSALVITALLSTFGFPFIATKMIRDNPKIMN